MKICQLVQKLLSPLPLEDWGSRILWNVIPPYNYMETQARRPRLESSPPWKLQISRGLFLFGEVKFYFVLYIELWMLCIKSLPTCTVVHEKVEEEEERSVGRKKDRHE